MKEELTFSQRAKTVVTRLVISEILPRNARHDASDPRCDLSDHRLYDAMMDSEGDIPYMEAMLGIVVWGRFSDHTDDADELRNVMETLYEDIMDTLSPDR